MLKLLAPVFVPSILNSALQHQSRIGFKVNFKDLPQEWIKGNIVVDMTKTWNNYRLPISGLNYFTLGALKNGLSTRFDQNEKLYQAWLGGYLFMLDKSNNWNPEDYLKVCEADQKKWLWYYGVLNPKMDFGKPSKVKELQANGIKGRLYAWTGTTQSDVGNHSKRLYNRAIMDGMAYIMNKLNPGLKMQGKNFIPTQSNRSSYEAITISGYIAIMDISADKKALLYVCMSGKSEDKDTQMEDLITNHIQLVKV
jgi:hypothetical protein